ncbi:MAG: AraC family transcriptional regulator [Pseudomonadota bacterium]
MLILDAALRFSAITLLCLTGVLALRDARRLLQARLAAALCLVLSAMLVNTMMPSMYGQFPREVAYLFWFLHIPNLVMLWLFGLSLYQDDFRLGRLHWGVLAATYIALMSTQVSLQLDWNPGRYLGYAANRIIAFGALAHLLWTAISGFSDDLVERRRRTRLWFTLGVAVTALLVITGETAKFILYPLTDDPAWMSTLRVVTIWPMIMFGSLWFLRINPEDFKFETVTPAQPVAPAIDPKDSASHARLISAMEDGAFLQQGLTIASLARKIEVPEHQLRAIINQGLGYRNFASFLNHYRLGYAKTVLEDPERARLPVLTIAMDAGYNSLAPFNRAFKASEGVTPSEYRARVLGARMSDPEKS